MNVSYDFSERVVIVTHVAIVTMYFAPNVLLGQIGAPFDAFANSLFLASTALIVIVGQIFNYRAEHQQYTTARDLEATRIEEEKTKQFAPCVRPHAELGLTQM